MWKYNSRNGRRLLRHRVLDRSQSGIIRGRRNSSAISGAWLSVAETVSSRTILRLIACSKPRVRRLFMFHRRTRALISCSRFPARRFVNGKVGRNIGGSRRRRRRGKLLPGAIRRRNRPTRSSPVTFFLSRPGRVLRRSPTRSPAARLFLRWLDHRRNRRSWKRRAGHGELVACKL